MKLNELLEHLTVIQLTGDFVANEISGIFHNSTKVTPGSLFVAIKGYKTDGHLYAMDAFSKGAAAIVVEDTNAIPDEIFRRSGKAKIVVSDSRKALALLSGAFYRFPSKKLRLYGITGTKGKTTTSFFVKKILEKAGHKTGLIGTIANMIGETVVPTELTTPESVELNALFARMVEEGCTAAVMEVSSHSLFLNRTYGLDFDGVIFTNLSSEHRDFHETMDDYATAKKILFDNLKSGAPAVFNMDDQYGCFILKDTAGRKVSFGKLAGNYRIENIEYDFSGTSFVIDHYSVKTNIRTALVGEFNAYNAAAAYVLMVEAGYDQKLVIEAIGEMPQVDGRFELIKKGDKKVLIDYAHSPGALEQVLISINSLAGESPVYTVVGCGGNRDRMKRPVMGKIASEMSSVAVITSDNPRDEDPEAIIKEVVAGIQKDNYLVYVNREEAIKRAITESPENSIILVAGKGHEDYQIIKGVKSHFSDREIAEKYLKEI
ncbi:MAG: UDP-N-acetylmuramoyl-L-alanyl-D-glutamate--2,6-diaminopimelate ligase [Ignavibacteriales bacterium]|nr:MAG: UDP-N-acetylmuramoyl-L-alanyl-D-glutamate--2,6-diaminopimelate ligase [Ignavibacteriaceae bacterium]MBW7874014.1 UDP-N-acetylmuramoyl-L-alanyl-D-glutamate--2,6-diaminopimelate ligase [Ignavibacteria bacterium]MCZ2143114.1 UDP-N-acetylmuramoyl-L-alanyl-D-glutamate--2,6-diaminopimelate ligase [Ignavibacteriales bacterium]OQY73564.1 MAG: UDP-N-acetylmuramoyl-L-alanyl-D-glutamate--2,6-diaminopimelate ligase [Ignavibacteriales bacterium UTCHB3]MBV6443995.1 UDP-N-acetylmuramoyl-L-alanyl-D-glu